MGENVKNKRSKWKFGVRNGDVMKDVTIWIIIFGCHELSVWINGFGCHDISIWINVFRCHDITILINAFDVMTSPFG